MLYWDKSKLSLFCVCDLPILFFLILISQHMRIEILFFSMQTIVFITEMIKLDNFPQSAVSYRIFSDLNCKQWSATGKGYKCWTNSKLLFTHLYLTYLILSNKIRCSRLIYQNKMSATVRCIFQCDNKFTRKRDIDAFYKLFLVTAHPEAAGLWRALAGCFLPSQSEQFKTGIPNIAFLSLDRNVQESRTNKQTKSLHSVI